MVVGRLEEHLLQHHWARKGWEMLMVSRSVARMVPQHQPSRDAPWGVRHFLFPGRKRLLF